MADASKKATQEPEAVGEFFNLRDRSATSVTFARDSGASTTVSSFAVSVLTVNDTTAIRRLVLNQPPRTTPACPPDPVSHEPNSGH
jgi:hypothetical protein